MKEIPTSRYTAVGAALVFAGLASGIAATHMASDTTSTTTIDQKTGTVLVGGPPVLIGTAIAGQIVGKYHPLPWVGTKLRAAYCPPYLQARVGATITCVGSSSSGAQIKIPVHVTAVSGDSATWTFDR